MCGTARICLLFFSPFDSGVFGTFISAFFCRVFGLQLVSARLFSPGLSKIFRTRHSVHCTLAGGVFLAAISVPFAGVLIPPLATVYFSVFFSEDVEPFFLRAWAIISFVSVHRDFKA